MRTKLLACLALLAFSGAVLAQAYKWVDEDGVVHYSDRPVPGAERVELPRYNKPSSSRAAPRTTPRSRPGTTATVPTDSAPQQQPFAYSELAVASPAAEETLWNIEGVLNVTLSVQPALQPGHQVRVYFDGEPQIVSGTSFQLQEVYRGVHNIQAEIVNESGQLMIRSLPNRFYVQQNSVAGN